MKNYNFKIKNDSLTKFVVLLLATVVAISGLTLKTEAEGPPQPEKPYNTNFDWNDTEEVLNEWPLEEGLEKVRTGIGTAGFSYSRFYHNDQGRVVLEFDLSIFPDDTSRNDFGSNYRTFRNQWDYAHIFIDPDLATKVDNVESFFMMSYPIDSTTVSLNKAERSSTSNNINNVYKLNVNDVYPTMPTNSDYMKSKLYLVLNDGVVRDDLNQDYAVELRYTNDENQIYDQKMGSNGISLVLGNYYGHVSSYPTFDVSVNNDDVTLKTVAPFQTASMPNTIPNPVLPPDMMRTVGQSVIYDNVSGKLIVYYKQAPNHYIYTNNYANNGYFLSSWIGIRQVMDARIYNALKPDANGVVGHMKMFDLNGGGTGWNVTTSINENEFTYTPTTNNVGTQSYMMVPQNFKSGDIANKAIAPGSPVNLKNVYLHGHKKEADYVRFIYNVDKNKMDELFETVNSSTLSISTSYITDRPTEKTQTEYRLSDNIVIPRKAVVAFDLPKTSRSVFKVGLGNNYERLIGDMTTKRSTAEMNNYGVDPTDFGKAYTITPYVATSGGFLLTMETGLTISNEDSISLTMFDSSSPDTVTMTVTANGVTTPYVLEKHAENEDKLYTMPNANVRSGIIINRSANTPHIDEFFTDSTAITGHSKYPNALVSGRIAKTVEAEEEVFKEAASSNTPESFVAEGVTYKDDNAGYAFTLDIPADVQAQLKKDMAIKFSNAAAGYFRSIPSIYRTQAKVTFDINDGVSEAVKRIVPINEKAYGEDGYTANGFQGPNILWLNENGYAAQATDNEYLSDYEGEPITDTADTNPAYTSRQFYAAPPEREGYTFLGWSTKQVDSMGAAAFGSMPVLDSVDDWNDGEINYKFTATSPVDQSRTVYAVWERNEIDWIHIVLHNNNDGADVKHTIKLPIASISDENEGELTVYHGKPGNVLFENGFSKPEHYFVGWSEDKTVLNTTEVHELFTNGSKVKLVNVDNKLRLRLQLNEVPQSNYDDLNPHTNLPKLVETQLVNENGVAEIHLYAQYKPLLNMTATKQWFSDANAKQAYENHVADPETYPHPTPDSVAHFDNSNVAMVLMRTTEGKSLDPTDYEIVPGFYVQGKNDNELQDGESPWAGEPQEGHDPYGRKYSYLMTEFNAQPGGHDEDAIIEHFNNKRTWASMYITMIGKSDSLSKWTAISFADGEDTLSYMAVATSNQPNVMQQLVNSTVDYKFVLRNFTVDILPPIIHRIQENHTKVVIDSPTDDARYLYLTLDEGVTVVLFAKGDNGWEVRSTFPATPPTDLTISENTDDGILTITSGSLNFTGKAGKDVYALFTLTNDNETYLSEDYLPGKYASRTIQPYDPLPAPTDIKQEPHIKDEDGAITHNVVSAKIPAGSYAGAEYTLGYMEGEEFKPIMVGESQQLPAVTPDETGKLTFKVPTGKLGENVQYVIRGVDPADTFAPTVFEDNPVTIDLTPPDIDAESFAVISGNPIGDGVGEVTTNDPDATLTFKIKKGDVETSLPEGITFDPVIGKFTGKTADVLEEDQDGVYTITITAEDFYGNVSTDVVINLTITQKETTGSITSITQSHNDLLGKASLSVEGLAGATVKLYSKNADGTFAEIEVQGVSGQTIEADGTFEFKLPQADIARFNDRKVYVTQKLATKLESNKIESTEVENRKDNKKIATGGVLAVDNIPPTPLQLVQPKEWTDSLKITNVSADENVADIQDIDRIVLQIGDNLQCEIERLYDENGDPTGEWECNTRKFFEIEEEITVIIDPNTGQTETKTVKVLNYKLPPGSHFVAYQSITATYYDYLGNASLPVSISVLKLPEPIAPYDMTAINDSQAHPTSTVIKGKADPGADIFVTIGGQTYSVTANEFGEFTLVVFPKQDVGNVITVTSKLNNYTATGTVIVENVQADDYEPQVTPIQKPYGEATTEGEIKAAVTVPNYPPGEEQPVITINEGTELPNGQTPGDYEIPVTVTYPDGTKDTATVIVTVLPDVIDVTDDPTQQTPNGYVRVTVDAGEGTQLAEGQVKKVYD
ncbi:MAG: hypothetical protein GX971_09745, partial [Firmicutes bacterium]|nr:hypothetical protein [Bacillota bacterium]